MRTVIIDDEPKAIELLKTYVKMFRDLELTGTFRNGLKAFEFLSKNEVDLILLDIEMPDINGVALSRMLKGKSKIIFTTAYSEYAVESYEVEAVVYLLKPISIERFTLAIGKLFSSINKEAKKDSFVLLKSGSKTFRVKMDDVLYIQKDGNYSDYYIHPSNKVTTRESINEALSRLPNHFKQVHKSFIINCQRVSNFDNAAVIIEEKIIPVSSNFKNEVYKKLSETK